MLFSSFCDCIDLSRPLFIHVFMFLVQIKLAWLSLFSSLQQVPRHVMIVNFTSCLDLKSDIRNTQYFIFVRKSTDVRGEMFISIRINQCI